MNKNSFIKILKIFPFSYYQLFYNEKIVIISLKFFDISMYILKNNIFFNYKILSCISGIDYFSNKYRFCVSYDLLSLMYNNRIRIKVFLSETSSILSITNYYSSANWWEREVWDMFGIFFKNHPDLRRILTDYGFEGYPLRKDFPISGYIEVRYDLKTKKIIIEPLELKQEFRRFVIESQW